MQITSNQAEILIKAAQAKAADIGIAVSIVVLDSAGHLKAFSRMDGAWLGSIDVALTENLYSRTVAFALKPTYWALIFISDLRTTPA